MAKNYESNGSLEGKLERLERDCQKKDVKIELLEEQIEDHEIQIKKMKKEAK